VGVIRIGQYTLISEELYGIEPDLDRMQLYSE
jgi:hypothetical protein